MRTAVSAIASYLSTSSWKDLKFLINQFLEYVATHPNAKIRYHSIQMHLWIHSDASYLNESKSRSRNGGFFYLSNKPKLTIKPNGPPPKLNAPVLVNSKIIDTFMYSVQESETVSGFINGKYAVPLCNALHEMGHIQGPTPIQFDNIVANGIITDTVVQRIYKAMDMRFYWIHDQCPPKNSMFIGNKEKKLLPTIHQRIISQNITSQFDLCMFLMPFKKKKTIFNLPTTLQGFVQTHLAPTIKQPLY